MDENSRSTSLVSTIVAFAILAALVVVILAISVFPHMSALNAASINEKPVDISATFPDAGFRSYVSTNIDKDGNGYLTNDEIAAVTTIGSYDTTSFAVTDSGLSNYAVADLTGIATFTNLTMLVAQNSNIEELNISSNTALRSIDLRGNPKFDISYSKPSNGTIQLVVSTSEGITDVGEGIDLVQHD